MKSIIYSDGSHGEPTVFEAYCIIGGLCAVATVAIVLGIAVMQIIGAGARLLSLIGV